MLERSRQNIGTKCGPLPSLAAKAKATKVRVGGRLLRNTVRDPALVYI